MTIQRVLGLILLGGFLLAGDVAGRAVILPPQTQAIRGVSLALSASADVRYTYITAQVRNDSTGPFLLKPEQVSLSRQKPAAFTRKTVLPDSVETLTWRFPFREGEYILRILDLEYRLMAKAVRPEIPYYLEKTTVYNFADGDLQQQSTGQGILLIDTEEELLDVWLKSDMQFLQIQRFDYAHWLSTANIPAEYQLLLKSRTAPEGFMVFDKNGKLLL